MSTFHFWQDKDCCCSHPDESGELSDSTSSSDKLLHSWASAFPPVLILPPYSHSVYSVRMIEMSSAMISLLNHIIILVKGKTLMLWHLFIYFQNSLLLSTFYLPFLKLSFVRSFFFLHQLFVFCSVLFIWFLTPSFYFFLLYSMNVKPLGLKLRWYSGG